MMAAMNATDPRGFGPIGSAERRILLIEDSSALAERLVELLSEPGRLAVAAKAATQSDAVLRLRESSFDVLVVDIELAEGNGGRG